MSRRCPTCATLYPDEGFFCGHDGAITIEEQDPNDHDPRLGARLGEFIVVARVADGAMGRVYEGRHPTTRARVAIKVLHAYVAREAVNVERFRREFEVTRELEHPNVVKVFEFGSTPDRSHFMTMEYLVGEELGEVLRRDGTLPIARMLRIVCQTARALAAAHAAGVIHRDLKPDNVYLCRDPEGDAVRLLDFGSLKLQVELGPKLTAVGTTLGSPYYMSPEQALGKPDVDPRSDVFALATIVYEMTTGQVPFEGRTVADIMMKLLNERPSPPSAARAGVPLRLDAVIARALAKEKSERYGSAIEFARELLGAFGLEKDVERWAATPLEEVERALAGEKSSAAPATRPERPVPVFAGAEHDMYERPGKRMPDPVPKAPRAAGPFAGAADDFYERPSRRSTGRVVGIVLAGAMVAGGALAYLLLT